MVIFSCSGSYYWNLKLDSTGGALSLSLVIPLPLFSDPSLSQEPDVEPGDIVIVLDEKEHSVFKRNGLDLAMEMVSRQN